MSRRQRDLKYKYGMTLEDYQALHDAQGGLCFICQEPSQTLRLHVDHDHDTGKVRGLVCRECNLGLANFKDSPAILAHAAAYLKRHTTGESDMDYLTEARILDQNAATARLQKDFIGAQRLQKEADKMYRLAGRTQ